MGAWLICDERSEEMMTCAKCRQVCSRLSCKCSADHAIETGTGVIYSQDLSTGVMLWEARTGRTEFPTIYL